MILTRKKPDIFRVRSGSGKLFFGWVGFSKIQPDIFRVRSGSGNLFFGRVGFGQKFLLKYYYSFCIIFLLLFKGCSHVEVLFSHDRKKKFFFNKKIFWRGRNMYFTKNRVNLYRFVPIFTIFMFRPLQKKIFLTDKILKKIFLQKSLLPCEKHIMQSLLLFYFFFQEKT
jgi:hypothetical protein